MITEERFERIEKLAMANYNAIRDMRYGRKALVKEWAVYENKYREYLRKRDRFKNALWWLFCKITSRSTKLTEKELTKRTAKKMAYIFYKGKQR